MLSSNVSFVVKFDFISESFLFTYLIKKDKVKPVPLCPLSYVYFCVVRELIFVFLGLSPFDPKFVGNFMTSNFGKVSIAWHARRDSSLQMAF